MLLVMKFGHKGPSSDVGKYATIDYETYTPKPVENFEHAQIWSDAERAKKFQERYPFLEVFELSIGLEPAHL